MNNKSLKLLALTCKCLAIVVSVVVPMLIFLPRWGVNPVADVQLVGLAVLSLIPNRWLVFSPTSFAIFLLLAVFPFQVFFRDIFSGVDAGSIIEGLLMSLFLFAPLPLSLIFSWMRFRRGEKFMYA